LPVVVLPLADYERMKEDLEMLRSRSFSRKIRKAREAVTKGKTVTLSEAKKRLGFRL
jgi:PHD/YefM family antitoxin component YafN of YafNO toxin-antitoxin module